MTLLTSPQKYATLDAIRGVAAALIMLHHAPAFFPTLTFEHSYLAVDLFFMMSGFVIANAYDAKLAAGAIGWRQFFKVRFVRLYPLYLLGTSIGVVALILRQHYSGDCTLDTLTSSIIAAAAFGVVMLPSATSHIFLYPLNGPSWSLFFEMVANTAYAFFARQLTTRRLLAISAVSIVPILAVALHYKKIDAGFMWSNCLFGFVRVAYSFSIGIVLFRFRPSRRREHTPLAIGMLVTVAVVLCSNVPVFLRGVYIGIVLLIAFPSIVWISASIEPSTFFRKSFLFAGSVSYALYAIHQPIASATYSTIIHVFGVGDGQLGVWGWTFFPAVLTIAFLADKYYDAPVRKMLTGIRLTDFIIRYRRSGNALWLRVNNRI
jgi:peptidoglycan/LPS O-acetylase OafA/YrhL